MNGSMVIFIFAVACLVHCSLGFRFSHFGGLGRNHIPQSSTLLESTSNGIKQEELFRKFPYRELKLPMLSDCDNYYSGKYGDIMWHQNADNVLVQIPFASTVNQNKIKVKFDTFFGIVEIDEDCVAKFKCFDRIIPTGSFWTVENDVAGNKFVQLDLEKRFRMVNWPYLFENKRAVSRVNNEDNDRKSDILEKLFAANTGISKLTGAEPETIDDMRNNPELMRTIENEVNTTPMIKGAIAADGTKVEGEELDAHEDIIEKRRQIATGEFAGVTEIPRKDNLDEEKE